MEHELEGWTILLVDDDLDNQALITQALTFYGADMVTAVNGVEGLATLAALKPTCILLDLSMPVMDGWAMLEQLRLSSDNQNIPVIALTAHAMQGDEERVINAGFDGYIAKPIDLDSFLDALKRMGSRRAGTT